ERDGVLQAPIVVRPPNGRLYAVAGYRRLAAAAKCAPRRPLELQCYESDGARADDLELRRLNWTENTARADLAPWEIAEALAELRRDYPALTDPELAKVAGISVGYARNLLRLRDKAHPWIWDAYRAWDGHGRIGLDKLLAIVVLPPEEQLAAYHRALD